MRELIKENRIALDLETSGLRPFQHRLHLIGIGNEDTQYIIKFHEHTLSEFDELVDILEDRSIEKVAHNIAFDALWLAHKLDCKPVNLYCTMTMEKVAMCGRWLGDSDDTAGHGTKQYNLENTLVRNKFVKKDELDKDIVKTFIGYEGTEYTDDQINYLKNDVRFLLPLREKQWEKITNFNLTEVARMEKRFTEVLVDIQRNGITFDLPKWIQLYNESIEIRDKADKYLKTKKFINWGSPAQVLDALQELGIEVPDTNSNTIKYYLRDNKMPKMKRTILERVLEYRLHHKRATSFGTNIINSYDPDGKIRGNFNQLLATGRMSMSKPNLQQIPKDNRYRSCFRASPGKVLVSADYSSQELVIIGTGSDENLWLDAVKNGEDLHSMSAHVLFGEKWEKATEYFCGYYLHGKKCDCEGHKKLRDMAKTMSFGLAYGLTAKTYALRMGITIDEAEDLYDKYFSSFKNVGRWLRENAAKAARTKQTGTFAPFNRSRVITDAHDYRRKNIGRNTPIQGTGGDMMKLAAIKVYNAIRHKDIKQTKLLLLVHDEMILECHPSSSETVSEIVKICMEDAAERILGHDLLKAEPKVSEVWEKD